MKIILQALTVSYDKMATVSLLMVLMMVITGSFGIEMWQASLALQPHSPWRTPTAAVS